MVCFNQGVQFQNRIMGVMVAVLLLGAALPAECAARPADNPSIMDLADNSTRQTGYIYSIMDIFFTSMTTRSAETKDSLYNSILGLFYWSNIKSNQTIDMLVNESDLKDQTVRIVNTTVDNAPDILGPPNGTSGLTYLMNHSARVEQSTLNTTISSGLGAFASGFEMVGELYNRMHNVFGLTNKTARPVW